MGIHKFKNRQEIPVLHLITIAIWSWKRTHTWHDAIVLSKPRRAHQNVRMFAVDSLKKSCKISNVLRSTNSHFITGCLALFSRSIWYYHSVLRVPKQIYLSHVAQVRDLVGFSVENRFQVKSRGIFSRGKLPHLLYDLHCFCTYVVRIGCWRREDLNITLYSFI